MFMSSSQEWQVDVLDVAQKCVYCGYCSLCPTFKELKWENYHPRGILEQIKLYYSEGLKENQKADVSKSLFEAIFACTMCKACENVCIVDLPLLKVWEQIRQESFKRGRWNPQLLTLYNKIKSSYNIYGLPAEERVAWAALRNMVMTRRTQKQSPLAYFVGCQASYSGKMEGIAESVVKILRKAKLNFTILGTEEWCCGSPVFLAGGYSVGKTFAKHNLEQFKKLGVKRVVTACAGCYRAFKIVYPRILNDKWDIEVLHITELVNELLAEGKIKLKKKFKEKITFKDPCELVRHCGLIEAPREVIKQIPGVRFEELPSNREEALCCGGGGLLKLNDDELVNQVNSRLVSEIVYSEVDIVLNGCPTCLDTIKRSIKNQDLEIESIDIAEFIQRAMG